MRSLAIYLLGMWILQGLAKAGTFDEFHFDNPPIWVWVMSFIFVVTEPKLTDSK